MFCIFFCCCWLVGLARFFSFNISHLYINILYKFCVLLCFFPFFFFGGLSFILDSLLGFEDNLLMVVRVALDSRVSGFVWLLLCVCVCVCVFNPWDFNRKKSKSALTLITQI